MTDDQIKTCDALWSEALAAGLVRWMPGMWVANDDGDVWVCLSGGQDPTWIDICSGDQMFPEFADAHGEIFATMSVDWPCPANGGCLLALAREVTGDQTLHACVVPGVLLDGDDKWCVPLDRRLPLIQADTEPEALLRAILATRGER